MEARATLCAGKFPMYFKALENILKENGETGKTIAGFLVPISPFFGPHREFTIGTIFEFFVPFFAQNASFGPIIEKLVEHFVMVDKLIFSVETLGHS